MADPLMASAGAGPARVSLILPTYNERETLPPPIAPPPPGAPPGVVAGVGGGADLAVASRYVAGGRVAQWPVWRRLASRVATTGARTFLRLRVRDPLSGYFALRREILARGEYWGVGFKILLEILARHPQLRVVEVGYRFTARAAGRSKLSPREITAYLRLLGRLLVDRGS